MGDSLSDLSDDLLGRIAEIRGRAERLSPLDIHARMDAIRDLAARGGLAALEQLANRSAQMALLPGCRIAVRECLSHAEDAIAAHSAEQRQAILAAVAVRLH